MCQKKKMKGNALVQEHSIYLKWSVKKRKKEKEKKKSGHNRDSFTVPKEHFH